jgi:GT2 family glycosyltransferase
VILCDVIIPIWNQPEMTKRCLDSVLAATAESVRLILVDNGSEPSTQDWLRQFAAQSTVPAELIRNRENLGFIKAVNQGIRAARAPWVCLLNNDTVVTSGWLTEMIRVAESDPKIGLVNPTSNSRKTFASSSRKITNCARNCKSFNSDRLASECWQSIRTGSPPHTNGHARCSKLLSTHRICVTRSSSAPTPPPLTIATSIH